MNKIILMGRLTKDPELRYTQSGSAVASFTLAVNRKFTNQNGDREADFINCVAWQKTAEFVANYFKKGQMMALDGRLQVRSYDDQNGQRKWVTEVVAENIEFCGSKGNQEETTCNDVVLAGMEISFDDDDLPF